MGGVLLMSSNTRYLSMIDCVIYDCILFITPLYAARVGHVTSLRKGRSLCGGGPAYVFEYTVSINQR